MGNSASIKSVKAIGENIIKEFVSKGLLERIMAVLSSRQDCSFGFQDDSQFRQTANYLQCMHLKGHREAYQAVAIVIFLLLCILVVMFGLVGRKLVANYLSVRNTRLTNTTRVDVNTLNELPERPRTYWKDGSRSDRDLIFVPKSSFGYDRNGVRAIEMPEKW